MSGGDSGVLVEDRCHLLGRPRCRRYVDDEDAGLLDACISGDPGRTRDRGGDAVREHEDAGGRPGEDALIERPVLQEGDAGILDALIDRSGLTAHAREHDRHLGLHHVRGAVGRARRRLVRLAHVQRDLVPGEPAEIVVRVTHGSLRPVDVGRGVDGVRLAVGHEPERDQGPGRLLRRPERRRRRPHVGTRGGDGRDERRPDEQRNTHDPYEDLASHRRPPCMNGPNPRPRPTPPQRRSVNVELCRHDVRARQIQRMVPGHSRPSMVATLPVHRLERRPTVASGHRAWGTPPSGPQHRDRRAADRRRGQRGSCAAPKRVLRSTLPRPRSGGRRVSERCRSALRSRPRGQHDVDSLSPGREPVTSPPAPVPSPLMDMERHRRGRPLRCRRHRRRHALVASPWRALVPTPASDQPTCAGWGRT